MRHFRYGPALAVVAVLVMSRPAVGTAPAVCSDYRGAGTIRVVLQPDLPAQAGAAKNGLDIRLKQVFLRPDRMLLSIDWNGLKQQMLAEGSTEEIYQPGMGVIIEKRYRHLDAAGDNPIIAIQTSLTTLGQVLREAKSAHVAGHEKVLGYDCDVIEADSGELIQKLGGLLSSSKDDALRTGKIKAWVSHDYGVPVKLEVYTGAANLAMSLTMDELQFNTGVKPEDLHLAAPPGTKRVSVEVDLADKDWQQKMNEDLRKAMTAATMPHS